MDPKQKGYMAWAIVSGHDKAIAAAAAATVDVNCELTLQLPHYSSLSSVVDDDKRPPLTAFLPSPYTSLSPPTYPQPLPALPEPLLPLPLSEHVSSHCRRSSHHAHRGGGRCEYPYSVVRPCARINPKQSAVRDKSDTIPPPFPWAANRRAAVRSLACLKDAGIAEVSGESQCKHCEARVTIKLDLVAKFREVARFMFQRMDLMRDRAPEEWTEPAFPGCESCGQLDCVRPVMADKKRNINWLFLFLGQWLGICTLEQLKYFCKHTKNHRTGAKNRVLYLSYFSLCKQLDPTLPFVQ